MHRFYLPPAQCREAELMLTDREAHHARHVLRLRPGDRVTVLDGAGHEYQAEVAEGQRQALRVRVRSKVFVPPLPYRLTLVQALPKGKIFDTIVQKATELGVARIIPLLSSRVVTRLQPGQAAERAAHWQRIATEAIKQCGCAWLPEVAVPVTPRELLERAEPFDLSLIASLEPGSRHPRACFDDYEGAHRSPPQSIRVWVGPEGDFTPEEVAAIEKAGAQPITLGRWVLRAETASIYCLSVLNYELQSRSRA